MKVRFRVAVSDGAGQRWSSGQVADIDEDRAKGWLGLGYVEAVEPAKREAVNPAPRKATANKPAKKKRG